MDALLFIHLHFMKVIDKCLEHIQTNLVNTTGMDSFDWKESQGRWKK